MNEKTGKKPNFRVGVQHETPQEPAILKSVEEATEPIEKPSPVATTTAQESDEMPAVIDALRALGEPVVAHGGNIREEIHGLQKSIRIKAAGILATLALVVGGSVYCALASYWGKMEFADIMTWAFIGFCALIAVGQFLPALLNARAAKKFLEEQLQQGLENNSDKQHAYSVFDKN